MQISITMGIDFKFNAAFQTVERAEDGTLTVYLTGCDPIEADAILFAIGRTPNTDGLGLETAGVEIDEKGAGVGDADNKSPCDSFYAVGDVPTRVQLPPVAITEGHAVAEPMLGDQQTGEHSASIPNTAFPLLPMSR